MNIEPKTCGVVVGVLINLFGVRDKEKVAATSKLHGGSPLGLGWALRLWGLNVRVSKDKEDTPRHTPFCVENCHPDQFDR